MVEQQNVFWYYVGNRPAPVVIDGEPTLASPHKYLLAPAGQAWPKPIAHLVKRKTPPKEIMDAFGEAAKRTAEYRKVVEAETAQAERAGQRAERERAAAARQGAATAKLDMAAAISEHGKQDPPKEGEQQAEPRQENADSSSPPNETRAQRKKRLKAERAAADAAADEEKTGDGE